MQSSDTPDSYTQSVLQQFSSAGIPVEMISLGNEINSGLLLPVGNTSSTAGYAAASEILHSAASAVRQTSPSTKTMVHLADGWSSSEQTGFYKVSGVDRTKQLNILT